MAKVRALKDVLILFQAILGLKFNFTKSMLVGVNIVDSWVGEASSVTNFKTGCLLFLYLGMPIDGASSSLNFWYPLVECIKSRLLSWKSRHLFLGSHLVLLKSVMSSLPVYFLSFFKAVTCIIYSLECIFIFIF